ncbi:uncharacterized protein N7482_005552 [Penicillium canariense]|uniref:Uncharacterized protein n=1 Tax=Penicillium canariense TaxID=189055 RepID=A0A9W9I425_9EURO|nr:uncharacterized protein N7482_005552 [Penicillium canariense]KAJ5166771.1 hypothetical protein N7482_005552 [Penicillium canariense]
MASVNPALAQLLDDPTRDWSTFPTREPPFDQAVGLPAVISISSLEWPTKLETPHRFDHWLAAATNILRAYHLDHLIDINIPRPRRADPYALHWLQSSIQVQSWLSSMMTPHMYRQIEKRGHRIALADEFIFEAKATFMRRNTTETFRFQMNDGYFNPIEHTIALRLEFNRHWINGVEISPSMAFLSVLRGLEGALAPHVEAALARIGWDGQTVTTIERFNQYCDFIIQELRHQVVASNGVL